jgi:hypothetical protein
MRDMSWLSKELLDSQGGLCSMGLDIITYNYLIFRNLCIWQNTKTKRKYTIGEFCSTDSLDPLYHCNRENDFISLLNTRK